MGKARFLIQSLVFLIIIYCILTIIRSAGLLYLIYTDDYYYNYKFEIDSYLQKRDLFFHLYYIYTYILGLIFTLAMLIYFRLKWYLILIYTIFGIVLFRLIDFSLIRPLFAFFEDWKVNVWIHIITFLLLILFFLRIIFQIRKQKRKQ